MDKLIVFFSIVILLFAAGFFCIGFLVFVQNARLYFYLRKNKYDRWRELTYTRVSGTGGSNPIRWFGYLYSEVDNDDSCVLRFKDSIRLGLRQCLFLLLGALVVGGIVVTLIYINQ